MAGMKKAAGSSMEKNSLQADKACRQEKEKAQATSNNFGGFFIECQVTLSAETTVQELFS